MSFGRNDFGESNVGEKSIAVYGLTSHVNPDGTPSRCDCDYIEYNLYLYDNMNFSYTFQKGRLEPKYETQTGVWEIENEILVLSTSKRSYTDLYNNRDEEIYSKLFNFKIDKHKLCDEINQICLERRQGLRVEELFLKFK